MNAPAVANVYLRAMAYLFRNSVTIDDTPKEAHQYAERRLRDIANGPGLAQEIASIEEDSPMARIYLHYLRREGGWGV